MAIRFLYDNLYAAATLVASSEVAAMPVEASQDADRSYRWRSNTSTGEQTVDIDLGSVQAVDSVALANPKILGTAGTVELYQRGDSSSAGSATLVATLPSENTDRRTMVQFFASQSHRHWQLKWTTTGASDYAELGFAFLGSYAEPSRNIAWPTVSADEVDPSVVRMSVDRQRSVVQRTRYSVGRFQWSMLQSSDRDLLREIWGEAGVGVPVFGVLSTGLPWTAWMLYLEPGFAQSFAARPDTYDVSIGWEEAT